MATADHLLTIAAGELGTVEAPAGSNRTKYGKWYGLDGEPWCMMFVQWCFAQAGMQLPCRTASCSALLRWYRQNRPRQVVPEPRRGDIVIYTFGHTGIVLLPSAGSICAIEGNTSVGEAGSQDNGGGVYLRTRRRSLVSAYIRPEFEEDSMTGEEIYRELQAYLRTQPIPTWAQAELAEAVELGITDGKNPMQLIPRYQAAIMAKRAARLDFSKQLIRDIRGLLWAVTLGGLGLAAYCIRAGYAGSLPWLSAMVGLPWTAHGAVCAFYLNMAKSDHREGGITFECAKTGAFEQGAGGGDGPSI